VEKENPFEGKVALVTGAAGAIGNALSVYLAELGARVIAADVKDGWAPIHPMIQGVCCDLEEPQNMYKLVGAVVDQEGRLDFAAHCIGLSVEGGWEDMSGHTIRRQLWVNSMSAVFFTNLSAGFMKKTKGGHILLFGSGAEQQCSAGHAVYAMCKAGVRAYGEAIAKELKSLQIYVNVIWPSAQSDMNPKSPHSAVDVAKFACGLFMTKKYGMVFSVAGDKIHRVMPRELSSIDVPS